MYNTNNLKIDANDIASGVLAHTLNELNQRFQLFLDRIQHLQTKKKHDTFKAKIDICDV